MYPGVRMDCYALQRKTCDLPPVFTALFSKTPVKIRYPRSYDFIKITVFSHALRVFPVTLGTKPLYAETGKASNIPLCQSYKSYINIRPSFSQNCLYLSYIKVISLKTQRACTGVILWLNDLPQYEHKCGANASQYGDIGTDCVSAWHGTIHRI